MGKEIIDLGIDDLVEVELFNEEDFLKVKETLTRMGVSSRRENKLYQSCHILHKRGKYYIVHFKELFALDGLPTDLSEEDIQRRNTIACLLDEWELVEVVYYDTIESNKLPVSKLKIIPHRERDEWELCPKYHIGRR